jgi:hypothetical protein
MSEAIVSRFYSSFVSAPFHFCSSIGTALSNDAGERGRRKVVKGVCPAGLRITSFYGFD